MTWFDSSHLPEGACVHLEEFLVFGTTDTDIKRLGVNEDWQPAGNCKWLDVFNDLIEIPTVKEEDVVNPLIKSFRSDYDLLMTKLDEGVRELVEQGKEMQALWLQQECVSSLVDIHQTLGNLYRLLYNGLSTLEEYDSERLRKLGHEPLAVRACFESDSSLDQDDIESVVENELRRTGVWHEHRLVKAIVLAEITYMLDALEILVEPDFVPEESSDTNVTEDKNEEQAKERYIAAAVKRAVWTRDRGKCVQCESRERLEYDHIIPISKGGSNTERNVQLLCEKCNRSKGATI